ncbi:MAG: hypothetical protein O7B98_10985, partial [Alphaproteobacteria bacterium]|nr:hypothetical protein [Alphaproteobacteria bacterium]
KLPSVLLPLSAIALSFPWSGTSELMPAVAKIAPQFPLLRIQYGAAESPCQQFRYILNRFLGDLFYDFNFSRS